MKALENEDESPEDWHGRIKAVRDENNTCPNNMMIEEETTRYIGQRLRAPDPPAVKWFKGCLVLT